MDTLSKSKVPVAVVKRNKFDMSKQHLTTGNFMEFVPSYCQMVVPNSSIKINHKTFFRTVPLDKPTLGSLSVHSRAFFVPFSYIWSPFREFLLDIPTVTSEGSQILSNTPYLDFVTIATLYSADEYGLTIPCPTGQVADFLGLPNGSTANPRVLTPLGHRFTKFLDSLGYKLPYAMNSDNSGTTYSALPIMAAVKVYMDYYYPSAYANYGEYAIVQGMFDRNWGWQMSVNDLRVIASVVCYVAYSDDFFTSVWDNPTGPNNGVFSTYNIQDITFNRENNYSVEAPSVLTEPPLSLGTPVINYQLSTSGAIRKAYSSALTQYGVDTLKALTNYLKRHQYVGSRVIDRFLASYGIGLSNAELKRSHYLGEHTFPVDIGDVTSHASTDSASLGSYTGKAIGYSGDNTYFTCDADDFGMVLIFTTIVPDVAYVSGVDPSVKILSRMDYLQGEFDGLGPQPVTCDELDPNLFSTINSARNQIFGYAPRYYPFKVPYDKMTGGFTFNSTKFTFQGWSTARLMSLDIFGTPDNVKHSLDFVLGRDSAQFNRIFLGGSGKTEEPFIMVHRDSVEYYAPMKPLYDSFDFDEEEKEDISFKPNGVKMN